MEKPDVDSIEGLSPAISIEQKTTSRNPRSTVGTVTEIYDYMRLLFARVGIPFSPATGLPIESQTITQMVDRIEAMKEGTRLFLLAPIIRGRKGEYRKEFAELQKKGFTRVRVDGELYDIEELPTLDKNLKHDIEVVVDRLLCGLIWVIAWRIPRNNARAHRWFSNSGRCGHRGELYFLLGLLARSLVSRLTRSSRVCSLLTILMVLAPRDGLGTKLYFDPALLFRQ